MWEPVLQEINDSQKYLQIEGLNLKQCDIKLKALKLFLVNDREKIVSNTVYFTKETCIDLGISTEHPCRHKKNKQRFGESYIGCGLSCNEELIRNCS